jgi:phosphoglycolate phosphatase
LNTTHKNRTYLPGTLIEIINPNIPRVPFCYAMFDFDGTVSLIRERWQQVMISMAVEILLTTPKAEDEATIRRVVTDFVIRTTGQPTIYQMKQLAEEVKRRGGQPKDSQEYKRDYLNLLGAHIEGRVAKLKNGQIDPTEMVVPDVIEMLTTLRQQDITCYLASGTDEKFVIDEAQALGVADYFDGGIYGARDDAGTVSKKTLIGQILSEHHLSGYELAVFGDGYDEIEHAAAAGCIAVGVASNEAERQGINESKRQQLIQAGTDIIIPDFREREALLQYLGI